MYLFTDQGAREIYRVVGIEGADKAVSYGRTLSKKLKKKMVAWCLIGGDNPEVIISKKLL